MQQLRYAIKMTVVHDCSATWQLNDAKRKKTNAWWAYMQMLDANAMPMKLKHSI